MVPESFSPTTLLTPEQYLVAINCESDLLHRFLTFSGGTDIYTDLSEFVEALYIDLVEEGDPITRNQLSCWLKSRKKHIHQKSKELANEQDVRMDFSHVTDSPISMVFWNAGSMYSAITTQLSQQLEVLKIADASDWLDRLKDHVDRLVASSDDQAALLEEEFKVSLDSSAQMLKELPEQFLPEDSRPLLDSIQHSYTCRMKKVVLVFINKIYLDILSRTYDFFLPPSPDCSSPQADLLAIENEGRIVDSEYQISDSFDHKKNIRREGRYA